MVNSSFRYKEKLQEQENQFSAQQVKLLDEMQRDKEKFDEERSKREAETEAALQRMHQQHQVELESKGLIQSPISKKFGISARH